MRESSIISGGFLKSSSSEDPIDSNAFPNFNHYTSILSFSDGKGVSFQENEDYLPKVYDRNAGSIDVSDEKLDDRFQNSFESAGSDSIRINSGEFSYMYEEEEDINSTTAIGGDLENFASENDELVSGLEIEDTFQDEPISLSRIEKIPLNGINNASTQFSNDFEDFSQISIKDENHKPENGHDNADFSADFIDQSTKYMNSFIDSDTISGKYNQLSVEIQSNDPSTFVSEFECKLSTAIESDFVEEFSVNKSIAIESLEVESKTCERVQSIQESFETSHNFVSIEEKPETSNIISEITINSVNEENDNHTNNESVHSLDINELSFISEKTESKTLQFSSTTEVFGINQNCFLIPNKSESMNMKDVGQKMKDSNNIIDDQDKNYKIPLLAFSKPMIFENEPKKIDLDEEVMASDIDMSGIDENHEDLKMSILEFPKKTKSKLHLSNPITTGEMLIQTNQKRRTQFQTPQKGTRFPSLGSSPTTVYSLRTSEMVDDAFYNTIQSARKQLDGIKNTLITSRQQRALRESQLTKLIYAKKTYE